MPSRSRNRLLSAERILAHVRKRKIALNRSNSDTTSYTRRTSLRKYAFTVYGINLDRVLSHEGLVFLSEKMGGVHPNIEIIAEMLAEKGKPLRLSPPKERQERRLRMEREENSIRKFRDPDRRVMTEPQYLV
jgi:hypothetical protein